MSVVIVGAASTDVVRRLAIAGITLAGQSLLSTTDIVVDELRRALRAMEMVYVPLPLAEDWYWPMWLVTAMHYVGILTVPIGPSVGGLAYAKGAYSPAHR